MDIVIVIGMHCVIALLYIYCICALVGMLR